MNSSERFEVWFKQQYHSYGYNGEDGTRKDHMKIGFLAASANSVPIDLIKPILEAVQVNDSDTLSSLSEDTKVLWTACGSWSGPASIILGDLRKIYKEVNPGDWIHQPNTRTTDA